MTSGEWMEEIRQMFGYCERLKEECDGLKAEVERLRGKVEEAEKCRDLWSDAEQARRDETRMVLEKYDELKEVHEALKASVRAAPKDGRYRIVLEPWGLEWRAVVEGMRPGGLCFATGIPAYVAAALRREMEEYDKRREEAGCEQDEEAPRGRPVEAGPGGDDEENHHDFRATVKAIHARIEGILCRLDKLETRLNHRDKAYDRLHEMMAKFDHWPAGSPA